MMQVVNQIAPRAQLALCPGGAPEQTVECAREHPQVLFFTCAGNNGGGYYEGSWTPRGAATHRNVSPSGLRTLVIGIVERPLPHPGHPHRIMLAEVLHHEHTSLVRMTLRQICKRDVLPD